MAKKKKKAKKTKKTNIKRKPSVQKQLDVLCELVAELNERIAKLYLEVNRLRTPNPYQPPAPMPPYGTGPSSPFPPPYEVLCQGPTGTMYLGRKGMSSEIVQVKKKS